MRATLRQPDGSGELFPPQVGELPDLLGIVGELNWFAEKRSAREQSPLHLLLNKALPQRCQYRNFRDVCVANCRQSTQVSRVVRALVHCTLVGAYPLAARRAPATLSSALYVQFSSKTKEEMADWCASHALLVFYALKEYLIYALGFDPALTSVVQPRYRWQTFTESILTVTNDLRAAWLTEPGTTPLTTTSATLQRNHQRVRRHLYKLPRGRTIDDFAKQACQEPVDAVDAGDLRRLLAGDSLPSLPTLAAASWASAAAEVTSTSSARRWSCLLARLREADRRSLCKYTNLLQHVESVCVQPLPRHAYDQQHAALCARHHLPSTAVADVARHARSYACVVCRSVKAFVARANHNHSWYGAFGHPKMAYDDETDTLFCSHHKNARQLGPHPKIQARGEALRALGVGTGRCSTTPCVEFSLLGNVVWAFGRGYTLCGRCAAPMTVKGGTTALDWQNCESCREVPSKEDCWGCGCRQGSQRESRLLLVTTGYDHDVDVVRLCQRHLRRGPTRRRVWLRTTLERLVQRGADGARTTRRGAGR